MITFRTRIQVSSKDSRIGTLELQTYQPITRYQVQNAAHQALKRLNAIPDKSERTLDRYAKLLTPSSTSLSHVRTITSPATKTAPLPSTQNCNTGGSTSWTTEIG